MLLLLLLLLFLFDFDRFHGVFGGLGGYGVGGGELLLSFKSIGVIGNAEGGGCRSCRGGWRCCRRWGWVGRGLINN